MHILPYSESAIAEAVAVIQKGGVVAHATETCYGLACDLSNIDAVRKVFAIKQRPLTQPISGLFFSIDQAKQYVVWNDRADELAATYLPGPLTMILPLRSDAPTQLHPTPQFIIPNSLPGEALAKSGEFIITLGVRLSSHPHAQQLAAAIGTPISTTSANVHGHPNPYSAEDIVKQLEGQPDVPDLIIDGGILPQVPPSTVIDLTKETIEQKRQGGVHI